MDAIAHTHTGQSLGASFTIARNYLLFIVSHIYCVIVSVLDRRANECDPQALYLRSRYRWIIAYLLLVFSTVVEPEQFLQQENKAIS